MIIKNDKEIIQSYLEDNSGITDGHADAVYLPESIADCAGLIKKLYKESIPMTFSGNGTGMTGGRIPMGGAVISTERLKKIEIIEKNNVTTVSSQPGATLEEIKAICHENGLFFPVNPTEETATIGAAASNNSSGSWTYKYGSLRDNIAGMEFITKNGEIISMCEDSPEFKDDTISLSNIAANPFSRPLYKMPDVKNAAGYYTRKDMPLMHLIIGSEGTLGFISRIILKVLPVPKKVIESLIFFQSESDALDFVSSIREMKDTNNMLKPRSLEFFNKNALSFLREHHPQIKNNAFSAVIYEQEIFDLSEEDELLSQLLSFAESKNALVDEIWMADTFARLEQLRIFRHDLPSIVNERFKRKDFFKLSTDSSVPDDHLRDILDFYNNEIESSELSSVIFGHIGNNHFHVNLLTQKNDLSKARELYKRFMEKAVSYGGTVSAEHGIGKLKKQYLGILYGKKEIDEMKRVKRIFDPKNLFNKGNLIDL